MSDAAGDEPGRSNALHLLGVGAQIAGDLIEAREWMTQRLALVRATGNEFLISSEAANLSMVERQLGDLDAAEALEREALEIERRTGEPVRDAVRHQRAGVDRHGARRSSSARRPSSAQPRRSWRRSRWPGRRTSGRTTNGCWRPARGDGRGRLRARPHPWAGDASERGGRVRARIPGLRDLGRRGQHDWFGARRRGPVVRDRGSVRATVEGLLAGERILNAPHHPVDEPDLDV